MTVPEIEAATVDQLGAAALIGISARHFRKLYNAGLLPRCLNLGGRLRRWHRATIEAWLASGGIQSPASVAAVPV